MRRNRLVDAIHHERPVVATVDLRDRVVIPIAVRTQEKTTHRQVQVKLADGRVFWISSKMVRATEQNEALLLMTKSMAFLRGKLDDAIFVLKRISKNLPDPEERRVLEKAIVELQETEDEAE